MPLSIVQYTGQPTAKDYPAQEASSAEVERPWSEGKDGTLWTQVRHSGACFNATTLAGRLGGSVS